jgi:hypothetical protein
MLSFCDWIWDLGLCFAIKFEILVYVLMRRYFFIYTHICHWTVNLSYVIDYTFA